MELEQAMNIQPDSALLESIRTLQATINSQTTLIYVLIAIAALSLIIAFAAMMRGKSVREEAPAASAPAAVPAASNDGAVVAAITAAISCVLAQENADRANADQNSGFVVRRIRRV